MVPTHPPATRQPELLARLAISVFINSFQDRLVGHQLDKVATWAKAGNIVSLNRSMLSIRTALRRYLSVLNARCIEAGSVYVVSGCTEVSDRGCMKHCGAMHSRLEKLVGDSRQPHDSQRRRQ
jgi:hypothetical protein